MYSIYSIVAACLELSFELHTERLSKDRFLILAVPDDSMHIISVLSLILQQRTTIHVREKELLTGGWEAGIVSISGVKQRIM